MFQFCHYYGQPRTLVNGFRTPAGFRNPATLVNGFRNPVTLVNGFGNPAVGRFRNPATLVNNFRMPVGFYNPDTTKGNFFSITVKDWNTLTFVTRSSFLDVTGFLPYTKWILPSSWWSSLWQTLAASLLSQRAAF